MAAEHPAHMVARLRGGSDEGKADGFFAMVFSNGATSTEAYGEVKPDAELEQAMYREGCTKGYKPACAAVTSDAGASP